MRLAHRVSTSAPPGPGAVRTGPGVRHRLPVAPVERLARAARASGVT